MRAVIIVSHLKTNILNGCALLLQSLNKMIVLVLIHLTRLSHVRSSKPGANGFVIILSTVVIYTCPGESRAIHRVNLAWITAFVGACTFLSICLL
jgi:hypothetical protein